MSLSASITSASVASEGWSESDRTVSVACPDEPSTKEFQDLSDSIENILLVGRGLGPIGLLGTEAIVEDLLVLLTSFAIVVAQTKAGARVNKSQSIKVLS